jgi:hypothetical protein
MTEYEFVGSSDEFVSNSNQGSTWDSCREHRAIITKLMGDSATQGKKSLCVFGAGPCNDIELLILSGLFEKVTLVDNDSKKLRAGVERQQPGGFANVELLGDVDLFGITDLLSQYQRSGDDSLLDSLLSKIASYEVPQLATYDCVVSTCILSQLLNEASKVIDESHSQFVDVLQAIRLRHIQTMFSALAPGGQGILISDFVSSDSLPELLQTKNLGQTLKDAIANKNFLHGCNPAAITSTFQTDCGSQLGSLRVSNPWLWKLPERTYACFAIEFKKKAE